MTGAYESPEVMKHGAGGKWTAFPTEIRHRVPVWEHGYSREYVSLIWRDAK